MKCFVSVIQGYHMSARANKNEGNMRLEHTVSHKATEISANDAVPGRALSLVKLETNIWSAGVGRRRV